LIHGEFNPKMPRSNTNTDKARTKTHETLVTGKNKQSSDVASVNTIRVSSKSTKMRTEFFNFQISRFNESFLCEQQTLVRN